jgi:hypothetical protein
MLVIFLRDGQDLGWHVDIKLPDLISEDGKYPMVTELENVYAIQADGHELEHIINRFTTRVAGHEGANEIGYLRMPTIPISDLPVQRWYGDLARTILLNL